MNFRVKGNFKSTPSFEDKIENGEISCPQKTDKPPFNDGQLFQSSREVEDFISTINSFGRI
jgi:hypothetical protein